MNDDELILKAVKHISEKRLSPDPEKKNPSSGWSSKDIAQRIENGFSNADIKNIKRLNDVSFNVFLMQVAEVASEDYLKYL